MLRRRLVDVSMVKTIGCYAKYAKAHWGATRISAFCVSDSDFNRRLLAVAVAFIFGFAFVLNTAAQESEAVPVGNVSNGIVIYQARCANCHGPLGLGNGELAAQSAEIAPAPIGDPNYVTSAIPGIQYEAIYDGRLSRGMPPFGESSSNPLSDQEIWDVIAATHSLGTNSADLLTAQPLITDEINATLQQVEWARQPIVAVAATLADFGLEGEDAVKVALLGRSTIAENLYLGERRLTGQVVNETTGEPLANQDVTVVAFEEFESADTQTIQTDANGTFSVLYENMPADWVLRAATDFGDFNYTGDFVRFEPDDNSATITSNLAVYDRSADLALLSLERLRVVGELIGENLVLNELYVFENQGDAVFAGEAPIILPPNAQNIGFFQLLPSGDFLPVSSMAAMDRGFNYVEPILPDEPLDLLVRYSLPYDGELAVAHDLAFTAQQATLALPEGIEMTAEGWRSDGLESLQGEQFMAFSAEVPLNSLALSFDGQTRFTIDPATGNRVPVRNEQQELIIGAVALAVIIGVCAYLITIWQNAEPQDPTALLAEIAALDDAYAAKQIKKRPYEERRRVLITKSRDLMQS